MNPPSARRMLVAVSVLKAFAGVGDATPGAVADSEEAVRLQIEPVHEMDVAALGLRVFLLAWPARRAGKLPLKSAHSAIMGSSSQAASRRSKKGKPWPSQPGPGRAFGARARPDQGRSRVSAPRRRMRMSCRPPAPRSSGCAASASATRRAAARYGSGKCGR